MEDAKIREHIESLVSEEHRLLDHASGHSLSPEEQGRLEAVGVQLDRYWDLLRQRRARRDAGQDPNIAHMRSADVVEHYQQ